MTISDASSDKSATSSSEILETVDFLVPRVDRLLSNQYPSMKRLVGALRQWKGTLQVGPPICYVVSKKNSKNLKRVARRLLKTPTYPTPGDRHSSCSSTQEHGRWSTAVKNLFAELLAVNRW